MERTALAETAERVIGSGNIDEDDIAALRADVFGDGHVTFDEVGLLLEINRAATAVVPEWHDFFTEALTDFAVWQMQPAGHIDDVMAEWLKKTMLVDGKIGHFSELDALISVIEKAKSCPPALSALALSQVSDAVLNGHGAARRGRPGVVGEITADDVALIRRILFAYGGAGNVAITRAEAEVLFDLNDRTAEADNHPDWTELFVQAIANCLMSACGYTVPTRDDAIARARWLDARGGVGDFFNRMLSSNWASIREAYAKPDVVPERPGAGVDMEEARWLADRIGRDGVLHENEKALLALLRDESPNLPAPLQTLIDAA